MTKELRKAKKNLSEMPTKEKKFPCKKTLKKAHRP
jgi:hypothetical protein